MSEWVPSGALQAPFAIEKPIENLGRALWLYLHLVRIANPRGVALRTSARLAEDLALPEPVVEEWLGKLSGSRLIEIQSPAPFLVIKLPFWSNHGDSRGENRGQPSASAERSHSEVPVGSSSTQQAAAFNQAGEGGPGEGEEFLAEVLRTLDDADPAEVREAIAGIPPPVVLKSLIRVKTTPASQIRKSKLALFRYLLTKFTANPHAH